MTAMDDAALPADCRFAIQHIWKILKLHPLQTGAREAVARAVASAWAHETYDIDDLLETGRLALRVWNAGTGDRAG